MMLERKLHRHDARALSRGNTEIAKYLLRALRSVDQAGPFFHFFINANEVHKNP